MPTFRDMSSLKSYLQDSVLKHMMEQVGKQINIIIREYIESSFYGQYDPLVYRRTYQLLNSVTTGSPVKSKDGYKIEIFLDENKATYYDSINWETGEVGEEVDTGMVFNYAAQGKHGPKIRTWGRFMDEAIDDIHGPRAKEIIWNFRRYLQHRGFKVI